MRRISWRLLFELIVCLGASVPPAMAQESTTVRTRPIACAEAELRQRDESSTADSRRTLLYQSDRIGPDGAFVAGRRVAGLEQIVQTASGRNRARTSPPRPRTRRRSLAVGPSSLVFSWEACWAALLTAW